MDHETHCLHLGWGRDTFRSPCCMLGYIARQPIFIVDIFICSQSCEIDITHLHYHVVYWVIEKNTLTKYITFAMNCSVDQGR